MLSLCLKTPLNLTIVRAALLSEPSHLKWALVITLSPFSISIDEGLNGDREENSDFNAIEDIFTGLAF